MIESLTCDPRKWCGAAQLEKTHHSAAIVRLTKALQKVLRSVVSSPLLSESTLISDSWYDLQMEIFATVESDNQSQLNMRSYYLKVLLCRVRRHITDSMTNFLESTLHSPCRTLCFSPPETQKTSSSWDLSCLLNWLWHVKLVLWPFKSEPCWVYDDLLKCVFEFPLFQQQQQCGCPQVKGPGVVIILCFA